MLAHKVLQHAPRTYSTDLTGLLKRKGAALHVDLDNNRVVERRTTELKRLRRRFGRRVARPCRFEDDDLKSWLHGGFMPASQRWCPQLERDIRAVCAEVALSRAAVAAVVAASSRGLISQNPGVLLSRLLTFVDCLEELLGRRATLAVIRLAPSLLNCSPESLRWNAEMLGGLIPESSVSSSVVRAPMLLSASPITLWGNFEGLAQMLGLGHAAAVQVVLRQPRLLLNSRGALEGRHEELLLLTGIPPARLAACICRQPGLLGYFPRTLELNMEHIAAELGVPFSRVQRLFAKQPALFMLRQASFSAKHQALRQAIGNDDADAAAMVMKQPGLLTQSTASVRAKMELVQQLLGLEAQLEVRAVLLAAPQLLTLSLKTIEDKHRLLLSCVQGHPALEEQLAAASKAAVAQWLCYSARRFERVRQAAAAAPLPPPTPLYKMLQCTDAVYARCLQQQQQQQQEEG